MCSYTAVVIKYGQCPSFPVQVPFDVDNDRPLGHT
jgi:hypothetical protein